MSDIKKEYAQENENIQLHPIEEEMKQSYIDYAMSVIVSRALPDVRDGLKPVQRRILYAMYDMKLTHNAKYKKSAAVVGEVLGKYHPHGDSSVYEAMVRMAQDFSLRYPLIDGQGNFGSIDGDSAAAMRYCVVGDTRIRTNKGTLKIQDIVKNTKENSDNDVDDLYVLGKDGEYLPVSKLFNSGKHKIYKLTTKAGFELRGTANHPVLTWTLEDGRPVFKWKLLENIQENDIVVIDRTFIKDVSNFDPLDVEKGIIYGALISEGFVSEDRIGFNNTDKAFFDKFVESWKVIFGDSFYTNTRKLESGKTIYEFDCQLKHSKDTEKIKNSKLYQDLVNVKSENKFIPDEIFAGNSILKLSFLKALFEGDGSISLLDKNTISIQYTSSSEKLIKDLQILLTEFGIIGKIYHTKKGIKLSIGGFSNILQVKSIGGLFLKTKGAKFSEIVEKELQRREEENSNGSLDDDFIPFIADYIRKNIKSSYLEKHNFDRYSRIKQNYEKILEQIGQNPNLKAYYLSVVEKNYFYDEVVEIKEDGEEIVYSPKVESSCHSYIGNAFVNHNTEARLTKLAEEMLADIDKDTVDWTDNYDNSRKEPMFLPTKFPNLLCNGTMGIAVGMATNMPPHNLKEICDALIKIVENPEISHNEIMEIIQGPDFPTGGIIFDKQKISEVYKAGRGSIIVRGKVHIEKEKGNKIVIDELPYQVNKANLVAKIGQLAGEGRLSGIKNIVDESNKGKIRISIDLKPGVDPQTVLIKLYKLTDLQTTFPVNNIVLTENGLQPNLLGIKDLLLEFVKFRQNVVYRRSIYLLNKAKARLHILEGLQKAIDIIDDVIATIRASKTREEAKQALIEKFEFSDQQAEYILMLRLQTLVGLEIEKILKEIEEKKLDIEYLTGLVTEEEKLNAVVIDELEYIKSEYGDERRTDVSDDLSVYNLDKAMRDLKKNEDFLKEDVLVRKSVDNQVKIIYQTRITALPEDTYKLYNTNNQERLFVVDEKGNFINPRIKDLPSGNIKSQPLAWKKLGIESEIVFLEPTDQIKKYLVLVTNKNNIKKIDVEILKKMRKGGNIMKLQAGEKIIGVISVNDGDLLGLVTKNGLGIVYNSDEVRAMGKAAGGVTAIMLDEGDEIAFMFPYFGQTYISLFSNLGNGKSILTEEIKIKRRGRAGNVWTKLKDNEKIVGAVNIDEGEIKLLLHDGQIRTIDVDDVALLALYKPMEKVVGGKIRKILY